MKQGTTPTLEFKLDIEISNVTEVIFTFTDELKYKGTSEDEQPSYLLQKNYPDDATFEDDTFKLPLTQEETDLLTNTFFVEAQVICGTAVVKSDVKKVNMPHTLWTTYIDENESDGQSEVIHLSFSDNVIVEGGGTGDYNSLSNKPKINNIELIGNKTDTDLGLATKTELNAKQNVISGGNGIDVSSDVVSVDNGNFLIFENGKLTINTATLGSSVLRGTLANPSLISSYKPLATREYVDNLMSGAVKRLVVETLPTQNIDTNTIYMILKSVPTTNNIYDEYMYINNAWELIGSTEVDLTNYYTKTESDNKYQNKLTVGNGIDISNDEISVDIKSTGNLITVDNGELVVLGSDIANDSSFKATMPYITAIRQALLTTYGDYNFQPKLTAGTNITIDANNVISASGSGTSYTFTDGLKESSGTVGIDIASGSKLLIDANDKLDVDLSSKQDTIDSSHKLSADNVDDTNSSNKFVSATDKQTWNAKADTSDIPTNVSELQNDSGYQTSSDVASAISGKEDKTTISTDTTSTTVSLTLADNHEYRYTQDLTSLTLTMPSGDFISSIVFASGSTPTQMTYDSSIKWSGDDVTGGQFVPTEKTYNIVLWYDGLNINGVARGV